MTCSKLASASATTFDARDVRREQPKKASRGSSANAQRLRRLADTSIEFIASDSFGKEAPEPRGRVAEVEQSEFAVLQSCVERNSAPLSGLCATPLLTPREESEFFQRMNYCKHRAQSLQTRLKKSPELADELEDYLERAEKLRNHIIQANIRLVMSIARRFADARNTFDDLLSHGITSLLHVVEKFDYERGYRFSTYATCAIRRDLYRLVMKRKKDSQRYATGTGEQLNACHDTREPLNPNAEGEWRQLSAAVTEMLGELDEREKFIVMRRYGLTETKSKASYSRLGQSLGISKERVRQLANRAMDKLRASATDRRLETLLR